METATNRLVQAMRRHPLTFFYLMAFGWSWMLDVLCLGLWHQPLGGVGDALRVIIPGLLGAPAFPACLMTALTEGRTGMNRLLRRVVFWRVGVRWYLFVLVAFPALLLLSVLLVPGAITAWRLPPPLLLLSYLPALLVILVVGGPLAEEPGWRGFALPRLEQRAGPLRGTLILGMLWGLWHLPIFLLTPGYNGAGTGLVGIGLPFVLFVIGEVALAIIFTWVFNHTQGSVLLTMLLHASANTVIGTALLTQRGYLSLYLIYGVVAVLLIVTTRGRLSYQRNQSKATFSAPFAVEEPHPGRADMPDDGFHKP